MEVIRALSDFGITLRITYAFRRVPRLVRDSLRKVCRVGATAVLGFRGFRAAEGLLTEC